MGEKLRQAVLSGSQDDLKHLSGVSACGRRWFEMLQVFAVYHADIFGLFRCTRCCTRCTSYSLIVAKLMLIGFTVWVWTMSKSPSPLFGPRSKSHATQVSTQFPLVLCAACPVETWLGLWDFAGKSPGGYFSSVPSCQPRRQHWWAFGVCDGSVGQ